MADEDKRHRAAQGFFIVVPPSAFACRWRSVGRRWINLFGISAITISMSLHGVEQAFMPEVKRLKKSASAAEVLSLLKIVVRSIFQKSTSPMAVLDKKCECSVIFVAGGRVRASDKISK